MVDVGVKEAIDAAIAQIVAGIDAIISHRVVPCNELIASNLTEDDGDKHFLDLATALSEARKIVSVKLACARVSGSGHLQVYPNEGEKFAELPTWEGYWGAEVDVKDGSQRLQYALANANDVFNLYCMGYIVEA